jgi:hypothetical protein
MSEAEGRRRSPRWVPVLFVVFAVAGLAMGLGLVFVLAMALVGLVLART